MIELQRSAHPDSPKQRVGMQMKGTLRHVIRDGYQRILEVLTDEQTVFWIGTLAYEENNPQSERYVQGAVCDLQVKVQYVNNVVTRDNLVRHSFAQPIDRSPHCRITSTVLDCPDAYSFCCRLFENGASILVETEARHSLNAGQAVEFTGELSVVVS